MENHLKEVQESLSQFIIDASKKGAPSYAVQALPEAVKVLIELNKITRLER